MDPIDSRTPDSLIAPDFSPARELLPDAMRTAEVQTVVLPLSERVDSDARIALKVLPNGETAGLCIEERRSLAQADGRTGFVIEVERVPESVRPSLSWDALKGLSSADFRQRILTIYDRWSGPEGIDPLPHAIRQAEVARIVTQVDRLAPAGILIQHEMAMECSRAPAALAEWAAGDRRSAIALTETRSDGGQTVLAITSVVPGKLDRALVVEYRLEDGRSGARTEARLTYDPLTWQHRLGREMQLVIEEFEAGGAAGARAAIHESRNIAQAAYMALKGSGSPLPPGLERPVLNHRHSIAPKSPEPLHGANRAGMVVTGSTARVVRTADALAPVEIRCSSAAQAQGILFTKRYGGALSGTSDAPGVKGLAPHLLDRYLNQLIDSDAEHRRWAIERLIAHGFHPETTPNSILSPAMREFENVVWSLGASTRAEWHCPNGRVISCSSIAADNLCGREVATIIIRGAHNSLPGTMRLSIDADLNGTIQCWSGEGFECTLNLESVRRSYSGGALDERAISGLIAAFAHSPWDAVCEMAEFGLGFHWNLPGAPAPSAVRAVRHAYELFENNRLDMEKRFGADFKQWLDRADWTTQPLMLKLRGEGNLGLTVALDEHGMRFVQLTSYRSWLSWFTGPKIVEYFAAPFDRTREAYGVLETATLVNATKLLSAKLFKAYTSLCRLNGDELADAAKKLEQQFSLWREWRRGRRGASDYL